MKLPHGINPAHCASTDQTRYALMGVLLTEDLAVATDGKVLFACNAEREDDAERDAIIPTKAALAGFKDRKKGVTPQLTVLPEVKGERTKCSVMTSFDETTTFTEIDGMFPVFTQVVPDASKHTLKVAVNVKLLVKLAKAFGDDAVCLHLDPEGFLIDDSYHTPGERKFMNGQILVTGSMRSEAVGVLMPMTARAHDLISNKTLKRLEARRAKASGKTTNPSDE